MSSNGRHSVPQSQTDLRRGYTAQPAAPVSRWAAEGRSASHLKIYPDLLEHPLPCLPQDGGGEREAQDSLPPPTNPKIFISPKSFGPSTPTPSPRSPICRRLSCKMTPSRN